MGMTQKRSRVRTRPRASERARCIVWTNIWGIHAYFNVNLMITVESLRWKQVELWFMNKLIFVVIATTSNKMLLCLVEFKWKIIKRRDNKKTPNSNSFPHTHTHGHIHERMHKEREVISTWESSVGVFLCSSYTFLWFFIVFNYEKWSSHEKWKKVYAWENKSLLLCVFLHSVVCVPMHLVFRDLSKELRKCFCVMPL